jgi:hypothetical protein
MAPPQRPSHPGAGHPLTAAFGGSKFLAAPPVTTYSPPTVDPLNPASGSQAHGDCA